MKKIIIVFTILAAVVLLSVTSCDNAIGFIKTDNASYTPDSLTIPLVPDAQYMTYPWGGGFWSGVDKNWVVNNSNWATLPISGVLGTQPLKYSIANVEALDGTPDDANYFRARLNIVGGGSMNYPLYTDTVITATDTTYVNKTAVGRYRVSVMVKNQSYSSTLNDVFTFVVIPNR